MMRHCRSCRWWDQRYPENRDLGVCTKMGVLKWENDDVAIVVAMDDGQPTTDVASVRTGATFGCVRHTRPGSFLRTEELEDRP